MTETRHWQKSKKHQAHNDLIPMVRKLDLKLDQETRFKDLLNTLTNRAYSGLTPGNIGYETIGGSRSSARQALSINATYNISETLAARICSDRSRPRFMTVGGDYKLRRQAQKSERFVLGVYHQQDTYADFEQQIRDASWTGRGYVKIVENKHTKSIDTERIMPNEIIFDEDACISTPPLTWYQKKTIPVDVLVANYEKHEGWIKTASREDKSTPSRIVSTDMVYVVEAWHLPVRDGDKGRHVVCINNRTLLDETWYDKVAPLVMMFWSKPFVGVNAQGLVEQQQPMQRELNATCEKLQAGMAVSGHSVFVHETGVMVTKPTDFPGDMLEVREGGLDRVRWQTPQPMSNQSFMYADWIYGKQHETAGTSKMSATGEKPVGFDPSGAAIREQQNIETMRYTLLHRAKDAAIVCGADLTVRAARRLSEYLNRVKRGEEPKDEADREDLVVTYPGKHSLWQVKWSQVIQDEKLYSIQVWPSNLLPNTPAAKTAMVEELLSAQLIDQQTAMALMDFPDLELAQSLFASEIDLVDYQLDMIFDGKQYSDPKVKFRMFQNPKVAVMRAGQLTRRAMIDGAPESIIVEATKYIADASLKAKETQQAMQQLEDHQRMLEQQRQQAAAQPQGAPQ